MHTYCILQSSAQYLKYAQMLLCCVAKGKILIPPDSFEVHPVFLCLLAIALCLHILFPLLHLQGYIHPGINEQIHVNMLTAMMYHERNLSKEHMT